MIACSLCWCNSKEAAKREKQEKLREERAGLVEEYQKKLKQEAAKKKKEEAEEKKKEQEGKDQRRKKAAELAQRQRKDNLEALEKAKAAKVAKLAKKASKKKLADSGEKEKEKEEEKEEEKPKVVSIVRLAVSVKNVGTKREDDSLPDAQLGLYVMSSLSSVEQWKLAGQTERKTSDENPVFKKVPHTQSTRSTHAHPT